MKFLRAIFRRLASLVGVPEVQHRLDSVEAQLRQSQTRQAAFERLINKEMEELIADRMESVEAQLRQSQIRQAAFEQSITKEMEELIADRMSERLAERDVRDQTRLDEVQHALTSTIINHSEVVAKEIHESIDTKVAQLRRRLDNVQASGSRVVAPTTGPTFPNSHPLSEVDDAFYVALEDHFRGTHQSVRLRQENYLPLIEQIPLDGGYVLDLGCGRGEWLEILRSAGVDAVGVDTNSACIRECIELGLQVQQEELLPYLQSLPNESCRAVTMFQVLEHLPFPYLMSTLREIRRVLKDGGILIAEVPNSENLTVAASTFWIDPTHQRPLFPGLLKFIAEEIGFTTVDGIYSTRLQEMPNLTGLDEAPSRVLERLFDALYGHADFALIATA